MIQIEDLKQQAEKLKANLYDITKRMYEILLS